MYLCLFNSIFICFQGIQVLFIATVGVLRCLSFFPIDMWDTINMDLDLDLNFLSKECILSFLNFPLNFNLYC